MSDLDTTSAREARADRLRGFGAGGSVLDELLAYNDNPFAGPESRAVPAFPLADEAHIARWRLYETEARDVGAFDALKKRFVQLRFPIREGISQDESYRSATRRGITAAAEGFDSGLVVNDAAGVELTLCQTIAGTVPVLVVSDRHDFVTIVRAFTERNEPARVPDSMGACIVTGLNNWDRIAAYREQWQSERGEVGSDAWAEEFKSLIPRKELYQDRFVILSRGPYSATAAGDAGLAVQEWLARSLVIRREHEFTHYFTYRVFGAMRNNVLDELIADFVGLVRSFGRYRPELAHRFLGLEAFPAYRQGARLEAYRGAPPLSDEAFAIVVRLAHQVVTQLDAVAAEHHALLHDLGGLGRLTFMLAGFALEELASIDLPDRLRRRIAAA
jgi:hypothetical protein